MRYDEITASSQNISKIIKIRQRLTKLWLMTGGVVVVF